MPSDQAVTHCLIQLGSFKSPRPGSCFCSSQISYSSSLNQPHSECRWGNLAFYPGPGQIPVTSVHQVPLKVLGWSAAFAFPTVWRYGVERSQSCVLLERGSFWGRGGVGGSLVFCAIASRKHISQDYLLSCALAARTGLACLYGTHKAKGWLIQQMLSRLIQAHFLIFIYTIASHLSPIPYSHTFICPPPPPPTANSANPPHHECRV